MQSLSIATYPTDIATGFPKSAFYNFCMGCMSQTKLKKETSMSTCPPSPPNLDDITLNFRMRDPRFTALPVKDILRIRMDDLSIKNAALQKALDYPKPNVIAMMRNGTMSLPASKALVAAQLLEIDPVFLLNKVIAENDPALWDAIFFVMGDRLVTKNEQALIQIVRQCLDGHDVDLAALPAFVEAVAPVLKATLDRENALAWAAIKRLSK